MFVEVEFKDLLEGDIFYQRADDEGDEFLKFRKLDHKRALLCGLFKSIHEFESDDKVYA